MRRAVFARGAWLLPGALLMLGLVACNRKEEVRTPAQKGRTLYAVHCTACHNPDPTRDGALGPALAGSSLELLLARVRQGSYPPGYAPKRATHIMQKLPLDEDEVKALHAYLSAL